jgi:hypothetical protein
MIENLGRSNFLLDIIVKKWHYKIIKLLKKKL